MSKPDRFEAFIKASLEDREEPYDASQWTRLEQTLKTPPPGASSSFPWMAVASVTAVVGGAILLWSLWGNEPEPASSAQNRSVPTETTVVIPPSAPIAEERVSPEILPAPAMAENRETPRESASPRQVPAASPFQPVKSDVESGQGAEWGNNADNYVTPAKDPVVAPAPLSVEDAATSPDKPGSTLAPRPILPKPSFALPAEICVGEVIALQPANLPASAAYTWEINGLEQFRQASYTFAEPGIYTVKLYYSAENKETAETEKTVLVKPSPLIRFGYTESYQNGRPFVHFSNTTIDAVAYEWRFHDGSVLTQKDPAYFYRYKGEYEVTLMAHHANGCTSELTDRIRIEDDYNLLAPNAFTPNGDGNNDVFIPEALKVMQVRFTMTIYDRAGRMIYQTNSVDKPWDGRYMSDNQLAPEAAYVWVVTLDGESPYKGTVLLNQK